MTAADVLLRQSNIVADKSLHLFDECDARRVHLSSEVQIDLRSPNCLENPIDGSIEMMKIS